MSLLRRIATAVLGILLTTSLGLGMLLGTAHLTVLDPGFVTETIEEADGYETAVEQLTGGTEGGSVTGTDGTTSETGDGAATNGSDGPPFDRAALMEEVMSEEYLASQTEANVDRFYAYLHGERSTLNLSIDARPMKENASAAIESQIRTASVADLLATSGSSLPGPVDAETLDGMADNESAYREARGEFRADLREAVVQRLVDEAFAEASDDELLGLVIEDYDPRNYSEEEKARLVREREDEIRSALAARIEEEESDRIDREVEDRLDRLQEEATNATGETEMERAAIEVHSVIVRGLTGDVEYETFAAELEAAKADLAAVTGEEASATLEEEFPDRVDLTENFTAEQEQTFETARTGVQWLDRLALMVPAVVAVLLGLLYLATGSALAVARTLGIGLLLTGLPTYLGLGVTASRVESTAAQAGPGQQAVLDVALAFVHAIFGTLGAVSLTFAVAGGTLVVATVAINRGWHERVRAGLS